MPIKAINQEVSFLQEWCNRADYPTCEAHEKITPKYVLGPPGGCFGVKPLLALVPRRYFHRRAFVPPRRGFVLPRFSAGAVLITGAAAAIVAHGADDAASSATDPEKGDGLLRAKKK